MSSAARSEAPGSPNLVRATSRNLLTHRFFASGSSNFSSFSRGFRRELVLHQFRGDLFARDEIHQSVMRDGD
jgi:hypothetical protein